MLVIIGLIVGGVLVGQSLIRAAGVRATISQVEKYNTAANTFYGKYGYLPGDINASAAAQFGLAPRGPYAGEGDGNGLIEGNNGAGVGGDAGYIYSMGETTLFWVDLSQVGLIDGGFSLASSTVSAGTVTATSNPSLDAYFPQAKLGKGNYIYVTGSPQGTGYSQNYYGIAGISTLGNPLGCNGCILTAPNLTVAEAFSIDNKIDDGNGYSGRVVSGYLNPFPRACYEL